MPFAFAERFKDFFVDTECMSGVLRLAVVGYVSLFFRRSYEDAGQSVGSVVGVRGGTAGVA